MVLGIISNLEMISSKRGDVCRLHANITPFSIKDLSILEFWCPQTSLSVGGGGWSWNQSLKHQGTTVCVHVSVCTRVHTGPWKGHYHSVAWWAGEAGGGDGPGCLVLLKSLHCRLGLPQGARQATPSQVPAHTLTQAGTHSPLGLSPSRKRVLEPAGCCLPRA